MDRNNRYRDRRCPSQNRAEGSVTREALAMAYVPNQSFDMLYEPDEALEKGTIFAALYLPYCAGGTRR